MISPSAFFAPAPKPAAAGPGFPPGHTVPPSPGQAGFDECLAGASHKAGPQDDDEKRARAAHSHRPRVEKRPVSALGTVSPSLNPTPAPTKHAPIEEPPVTIVPNFHPLSPPDDAAAEAPVDDSAADPTPSPELQPPVGGPRPLVKEPVSATAIAPTQRTVTALVGESNQPTPDPDPSADKSTDDPATAGDQPGEMAGSLADTAAKIAAPTSSSGGPPAATAAGFPLQFVDSKQLTSSTQADGTPIANGMTAMNAASSTFAKSADAGTLLKRAAAVVSVADLPGRFGAAKQEGLPPATALAGGGPTPDLPTLGTKEAATINGSNAVEHFTKIETLLQTVLHVGEGLRPDGQGQMEMRLRLNGGADDVTVRWQAAGDRLQVTFLTDSPGLRHALETGWKQLTAETSSSAALASASPGGFASEQQIGGDFLSFQRRSPSRDADADAVPVPTGKPAPSTVLPTATPVHAGRAGGWRGWA